MARNINSPDWFGSLDQIIDDMPQYRSLYRDNGLWYIYDETDTAVLYEQGVNEDFDDFIRRSYDAENIYHASVAAVSLNGE